ncbi:acetyltransferase [Photobacterium damselae]|uniref:acetyltransferase n=1 Tax=Photobacterium damselae TaxID=38293 RepID=UPI000D9C8550|nr:acetyltransferase [Photobacterium damselae]NVO72600.1 acetyltransferase [Photobacterium damselae subsp. damselae]SPY22982.1 Galactoside O-acetyltransferase [Photobacterium damselae]
MNEIYRYVNLYGITGLLKIIFEMILTKLKFRNAKLIRHPFECRGRKFISIGKGLTTGRYCRIEAYSDSKKVLSFGENCQINDNVHIVAKESVVIEDNVLIASRVFISDLNHGNYVGNYQSKANEIVCQRPLITSPVHISCNVWLGEGVVVLPGVTIGENTIVGANSVVSKNLDSNCIYVGNPARLIKKYNFKTEVWDRVDD